MNPNYTEFKFPHIKAHPWSKVFSKRLPANAVDLVSPWPCCISEGRLTVAHRQASQSLRASGNWCGAKSLHLAHCP